jgi:hypothetical protein
MPAPGLRGANTRMEELSQEYKVARRRKDFEMKQRIKVLLLVSLGMAEREAARIVGVGQDSSEVDFQVSTRRAGSSGKSAIAMAEDYNHG